MDMQGRNYINYYIVLLDRRMAEEEKRNLGPPKNEALHQEGLPGNANAEGGARDDDEGTQRQATFDEFRKCREVRSSTVQRERERRWADCWDRRERDASGDVTMIRGREGRSP